jgi:predicted lipoprotein with Yx(FWY)xxD motif
MDGSHVGPVAGVGVVERALGSIRRPDGSTQATYEGSPLYRFTGDHAPGEANGDGADGRWRVVRPSLVPSEP